MVSRLMTRYGLDPIGMFELTPLGIPIAVVGIVYLLTVYGPGRYRFFDFLKVGAPLTVAIYLIAILLVPRLWPLSG